MGKVIIKEQHFLKRTAVKKYTFNPSTQLAVNIAGTFGGKKLTAENLDILDMALAIYHYEKLQKRYSPSNPIIKVTMDIWLRKPQAWTEVNRKLLESCLDMMGSTSWEIRVHRDVKPVNTVYATEKGKRNIDRVVLFSGGIDSTAGIATLLPEQKGRTMLCSFYSRQMTLQRTIVSELGFPEGNHFQYGYRSSTESTKARNRSFFYRSLFFTSFAAVLADSYNCGEILQFENGVLATSIPPSASMIITKHAHPIVQHRLSVLFSALLKRQMKISNPFLWMTKRQCVASAKQIVGNKKFNSILEHTETCWFKHSNFGVDGNDKTSGMECGVCLPCIVRRTAYPESRFNFDLNEPDGKWREDLLSGAVFRSYLAFTDKVLAIRGSSSKSLMEFYRLLSQEGRLFFTNRDELSSADGGRNVYMLFRNFAKEFKQTFP